MNRHQLATRVKILAVCTALTLVAVCGGFAVAMAMKAVGEILTAMTTMLVVLAIAVLLVLALLVPHADWLRLFVTLGKLLELLGWS
jgi:hypothetical protein